MGWLCITGFAGFRVGLDDTVHQAGSGPGEGAYIAVRASFICWLATTFTRGRFRRLGRRQKQPDHCHHDQKEEQRIHGAKGFEAKTIHYLDISKKHNKTTIRRYAGRMLISKTVVYQHDDGIYQQRRV